MARVLEDTLEDVRLLDLHIRYLPKTSTIPQRAKPLIDAYIVGLLQNWREPNTSPAVLQQNSELGRLILENIMELFHEQAASSSSSEQQKEVPVNDRALSEAYETLNRLIRSRSNLMSTYGNSFPIWHYGNLSILAGAILFIFLVLTDKTALAFLGGFQLRLCWSMLIGTFTMLGIVIYDLNSPLSGAFQVRTGILLLLLLLLLLL
jgi:hypothetical protein